jgi:hypothetical protein
MLRVLLLKVTYFHLDALQLMERVAVVGSGEVA